MDGLSVSPLKTPAIEIVDLSASHDSDDEEKREVIPDDASFRDDDSGEDDDYLSLYEDMLDGMPDRAEWEDGTSSMTGEESYPHTK